MQRRANQRLTEEDQVGVHELKEAPCVRVEAIIYDLCQRDPIQARGEHADADLLLTILHDSGHAMQALQLLLLWKQQLLLE